LKNQGVNFHKGFSIFLDSAINPKCNELKYQLNNLIRQSKMKDIDVFNLFDLQIPLHKFYNNPIDLVYEPQSTPIVNIKPLTEKTFISTNISGEIMIYHINN